MCWVCPCGAGWRASTCRAMYRVDPCRTEWRQSTVGSCAVAALVELGEPRFLYKCMLSRPNFGAAPALYKKRISPTTLYSISYILPKDDSHSSACYIELCVYRYKSHHPCGVPTVKVSHEQIPMLLLHVRGFKYSFGNLIRHRLTQPKYDIK